MLRAKFVAPSPASHAGHAAAPGTGALRGTRPSRPQPHHACKRPAVWLLALLVSFLPPGLATAAAASAPTNDYAAVDAIFSRACLDCHAAQDPEGKLVLETFATLMKGGESGPALVPGRSAESLLVKMIEGSFVKDGKKKTMPPGKRRKLAAEEVALIKRWIDAGAPAPRDGVNAGRELVLPRIAPTVPPRRSIQAIAFAPAKKLLALARYGEVELLSTTSRSVVRTLKGHRGMVNALAFSSDGTQLAAASGDPALIGEARLWKVEDGSLLRVFAGHKDALYALAISPDGKTLATGSYDQKIKLWDLDTGRERHTLSAHNGAVFSLAFRPDGRILASASGDRTVKLWNVATGKRVDTLSQPLKEQYAVAWSPDGKRLAAGGVDNRIRVWEVSENAAETTNPLFLAKFAHDGAILNLRYSPDGRWLLSSADDRNLKLWDAATITEKMVFELQPDLAPGLAFLDQGDTFAVGRLDGTAEFYDGQKGQRLPPPVSMLRSLEPRGLLRGTSGRFRLAGENLANITRAITSDTNLTATLLPGGSASETFLSLTATVTLARGPHDIWLAGPGGESSRLKLFVDDLPQFQKSALTNTVPVPAAFWGHLDIPGLSDVIRFPAKAGQLVVLELATKSVGSRLGSPLLQLHDASGNRLAADHGFDGADRVLAYRIPADGDYQASVADQTLAASPEHFYRLSIGQLPYVVGTFPLSAATQTLATIQLIGHNLPPGEKVAVQTGAAGELDVPIDPGRYRVSGRFKVLATEGAHHLESEPNNRPDQATPLSSPGEANGRIEPAGDVDLFRFEARTNEAWIVETDAARRGSPIDTRVEILHPDGQPVARLLLQAVRNTASNFRGTDSNATGLRLDNYEEMELDQYLYLNGDVMRLFRMPQGPDSATEMYSSAGKRRAFFDTTAVAHPQDEQGFIVEPHPVGTRLPANGLPIFTLRYENDDDGDRRMTADSKLQFTAPTNGAYLIRVTDTRSHGGDQFAYRLILREARPDFTITLGGTNRTVSPGSGQGFSVTADRLDGFEGEIRIDITDVPRGFSVSTPLIIQAGQSSARGTLHAALDASAPDPAAGSRPKVTATAWIGGREVTRPVGDLGTIALGGKPKVYVSLEPYSETATNHFDPATAGAQLLEITIAPGQTIPAWLKVRRENHADLITFFAENLPHGVIVADIGLNGVLIPKGESERQIFFTAARWVPDQDRLFHVVEQQLGNQTSRPVKLKVRSGRRAG